MSSSSAHRSGCPIGITLDVVGDRWTLLVVRDLMFMNLHEFSEFLASEEGIATNILSGRLRKLQLDGLVESIPHPTNGSKKLYYLTERGKSLLPLLMEAILWGVDSASGARVPPQVLAAIRKDRAGFEKETLRRIGAWEREHLADN